MDYYHTCYCLSGLAIAQRESPDFDSRIKSQDDEDGTLEAGLVLGDASNLLPQVISEHNLRPCRVEAIKLFFPTME